MHICFVTIDYHGQTSGGGIASYISTLGAELVRRGHAVTVLARDTKPGMREEQGMRVVGTPLGNAHWYLSKLRAPSPAILPLRELEWSWGLYRRLLGLAQAQRFDLIEGTETGTLFFSGQRRRRMPTIIRLHGDRYIFNKYSGVPLSLGVRLTRRMTLSALRRADGVTAPSRFLAQDFSSALGWSPEHIQVVPNPVSPALLEHMGPIQTDALRAPALVLYAGRLEHCKGVLPLLRSVRAVAAEFPDLRYVLAGSAHPSISVQQVQQLLDQQQIRAHVELLGHVPWSQLCELYRRATLFVMPSLYESFGISIIEAMAFGVPVLATTAGGIPEVVEHGVTGILVPPNDPEALAEETARLLRSPDLRRRLAQAGRERVLALFSVERVAEQMLAAYQRVCEGVCAS